MMTITAVAMRRALVPALCLWSAGAPAAEATFFRAINLNGPALEIDGKQWEGTNATNFAVTGKFFENQSVALKPATDPARARMIRSSVWGAKVDVEITAVPDGRYQIFLYVWEDTLNERFDLLVNDRQVIEGFHSGTAGMWKKLGPWRCESVKGKLKVSARAASHGAANLSGLEVWAGTGEIPAVATAQFVTTLTSEHAEFFERRIRPVLVEQCYECHSANSKKLKGGLMLDSRAGVQKGGDTGPAITPGDPEASLLIQAIRHTDADLAMPPKKKLSASVIGDFEAWVRMGAPDPRTDDTVASTRARSAIDWKEARRWWAFRPLAVSPPPAVKAKRWPVNGVDRFVLAQIEQRKLKPEPDADKRTLIRRATFDLIGLPPTPGEVVAFLADKSENAFSNVVERLLASPQYGERWGRHWLDVVRYADTAGDNSDFPVPQMFRYRNWVIDAFNRDLPYDQFVCEQIAGDLLPGKTTKETHERLIATGYIANARRFGSRVEDYPQHLTIEDTIDNLGRAFLGLTINCARCHDHKFDPITTADYYALYGIFHSTRYPWPGIELEQKQRDLVPLVEPGKLAEAEAARQSYDGEKRRLEKEVQKLKDSVKDTPAEEKKNVQAKIKEAERILNDFVEKGLPFEQAYAVAEAKPADAAVQIKGDPAKLGDVVPRRYLTVFGGQSLSSPQTVSGRRQLANWLVDGNNPLAARVLVNRIWMYHFGRGLVATPNDFGKQGKPPSHPELLDWLASRFIESGWSVKSMHRLIMLSRTYRLTSSPGEETRSRDANNELLSHFPRQRLNAEAVRDTLLVLGGNLDMTPAGPHPFPPQTEWKFTQHNPFKAVYDSKHRSVYLMTQRIQRHPYLAIFDGPDPAASTPARTTSTTPLQALYLLNDAFVHEQARLFAQRIIAAGDDDAIRLKFAYLNALCRVPEPMETDRGRKFLNQAREDLRASGTAEDHVEADSWQAMVRVLFRLNEFVYVD